MEKRVFSYWLESFRDSINEYGYYIDFETVYKKAEEIKEEINILNSLIGSSNIEKDFSKMLIEYPNTLKAIPVLLAVRDKELFCQDENGGVVYSFKIGKKDVISKERIDSYCYFMRKTGLFELLENSNVNNLYDYIVGVETGLNSNARKNRGGHQMEDLVESYIKKTGVKYYKEMYLDDIEEKWGTDLSAISAEGTSTKRWDFVVKTDDKIFLIETNFFTSGGSKLNAIAKNFKLIAEEAKDIDDVEFVWITDGAGWTSARRDLEETFNTLENMYNIQDMEDNKLESLFK